MPTDQVARVLDAAGERAAVRADVVEEALADHATAEALRRSAQLDVPTQRAQALRAPALVDQALRRDADALEVRDRRDEVLVAAAAGGLPFGMRGAAARSACIARGGRRRRPDVRQGKGQ